MKIPERPFFFRDDQENYVKTVRCWSEDLFFFLGDHLEIHAKTTTGGATPSEFSIDLVNFGPL